MANRKRKTGRRGVKTERERKREDVTANANWRKLAQDVKLHKTVSQWQAIARTSQPGSEGKRDSGGTREKEREKAEEAR